MVHVWPRAIAKRGLVLSRGHRADLATTRPKRFELWLAQELNYLLKLFTIRVRKPADASVLVGGLRPRHGSA